MFRMETHTGIGWKLKFSNDRSSIFAQAKKQRKMGNLVTIYKNGVLLSG